MADTKEQRLLDHILNKPKEELDALRGHPDKVLAAIDSYHENYMDIGPDKGKFITKLIEEKNPKIMIEIGGYLGYSAIKFASHFKDPKAKYYSFEVNEGFAKIATQLIDLAGLSDKVEIKLGKASDTLVEFSKKVDSAYVPLDLVFIDHWLELYVPDFRVLEATNLIGPGSIIAADNIIRPGAPDYAEYVQSSPEQRKKFNEEHPLENSELTGKWNILYDSHTETFKDSKGSVYDGVEVTKFLGYK